MAQICRVHTYTAVQGQFPTYGVMGAPVLSLQQGSGPLYGVSTEGYEVPTYRYIKVLGETPL